MHRYSSFAGLRNVIVQLPPSFNFPLLEPMRDPMRNLGAWGAVILAPVGFGMLLTALGGKRQTSRQWADEVGVDLATWCALGGIFLVGGLALLAIIRWSDRK
ncbi:MULTISPECIES: hypothetical protein [unclassified Caulobacter]|jgi:hypothetical protein|uniref:hypothetical protein n=1 Tax=unclassified Caulobacter TaxID=2648921 RepID=UPI000700DE83|nr:MULTISPECIES: hypothetical protein [unclassified Caulobacter]KQV56536.1 hypothetical protein ASC62_09385 [Caulobacter sp. Root342]KQV72171.1 hypothetical protein ASC70_00335 [Caulobacter sp. Root343]